MIVCLVYYGICIFKLGFWISHISEHPQKTYVLHPYRCSRFLRRHVYVQGFRRYCADRVCILAQKTSVLHMSTLAVVALRIPTSSWTCVIPAVCSQSFADCFSGCRSHPSREPFSEHPVSTISRVGAHNITVCSGIKAGT